jgi:hypothetical protein
MLIDYLRNHSWESKVQEIYVIGADPDSQIYSQIKHYTEHSLLLHDPPYENIEDTVFDLLKTNPNFAILDQQLVNRFRPLLMIFIPRQIRFENGTIANDKVRIWTIIAEKVDPNDIKISVIGEGVRSENTLRELLKFDSMQFKNEVAVLQSIPVDTELSLFRLRLFYKNELMDYMMLKRQEPSVQKPGWFKSIVNRTDPGYSILEKWIKGVSNVGGEDFERGVAILFCLCGLNALHVGGGYENAAELNRKNVFPSPKSSMDVLAWNLSNSFYICQCSLTSSRLTDKIDDIAAIANELEGIILKPYTEKPKVHPLVITNVGRNLIHRDTIEKARNKHVKIITGDELSLLINFVRSNEIITIKDIQQLLENTTDLWSP